MSECQEQVRRLARRRCNISHTHTQLLLAATTAMACAMKLVSSHVSIDIPFGKTPARDMPSIEASRPRQDYSNTNKPTINSPTRSVWLATVCNASPPHFLLLNCSRCVFSVGLSGVGDSRQAFLFFDPCDVKIFHVIVFVTFLFRLLKEWSEIGKVRSDC